ncbi:MULTISPECIES: cystathionine gamma-synthase [unclassified Colwellia]|jgi:cystathionine gamma-synthase|uniref:cystathionine gamma-synthase n=1 Tax=unclassified Colwellia TaxID=196834 RepID=UPI0015F51991|nr:MULTISPECIES: cystathionine gamma-synthase [unclassified Colwellia]MBA6365319.1 cystathionine gamma-synthase [Colwellia sp. BRX8-8]MBA6348624.1 cystathionine gamma-synthase [Colwellia sp. BRX8-9]MBA6372194.1 cystathionine gamma-synthase [Colwellia sp. BRX8-4]MBA6377990.1 cystathionine gamma-synthase [Colwellia sp. BRX10-7]MBA6381870.1 cystathionine gamma-synthase [Colwellia sp. BRX10-9]
MTSKKPATLAVRAGINSDEHHGAVVPAIHLSSTYALKGFNNKRQFDYSRTGNPTRSTFAQAIADLEQGAVGIVTSTGMSAVHLICQLLTTKDTVVIPHDCYGGSYRLFTHLAKRGLFNVLVVDQNDDQALAQALEQKPRLVLIESPSNPLLRLVDIKKVTQASHAVGALVAVDNTFLSPLLQQPLLLGADIVFHSTTKYINGHSDVVGGVLVTKEKELGEELAWWANCIGITGSPFDSYLALRGLKTLPLRMKQHQENANAVAKYLENHRAINAVYFPGLKNHPGHEIAKRQQKDFGAMMSFEIKGGVEAVKVLFDNLSLFTLAQSLGGVESLISHPSTMTHAGMEIEAQIAAGITQSLIRISVGIEDVSDIINDLEQALSASQI